MTPGGAWALPFCLDSGLRQDSGGLGPVLDAGLFACGETQVVGSGLTPLRKGLAGYLELFACSETQVRQIKPLTG